MMGRGKAVLVALLLCAAVTMTGCWDAIDPKDLDVATGLAFATSSEGVEAVAEVPAASVSRGTILLRGSPSGPPSFLIAGSGKDVLSALAEMGRSAGKEPYWGQLYSLYFSTALAQRGLADTLNTIMRIPELSNGTETFLIDGPPAPFLATIAGDVEITSIFTREHLGLTRRDIAFSTPLYQLFVDLHTQGQDAALPVFRRASPTSASLPAFQAEGMGVFRGDKLATILMGTDSQAFTMWMNNLTNGNFIFQSGGESLALRKVRARTRVTLAGWSDGLPVFGVDLHLTGELQQVTPEETIQPEDVRQAESEAAQTLEQRVNHMLTVLQKADSDPLGMGSFLRYHDPAGFASVGPWRKAFPHVTFQLHVSVHITGAGLLS